MITLKRLEEAADHIEKKALANNCDVQLEHLEDCASLEEAYYLGRYEQIMSLIQEADENGTERLFNQFVLSREGH